MVTLFVHDHRFMIDDGVAYSDGKFSSKYWDRYKSFSSRVIVLSRSKKCPRRFDAKFYSNVNADNVSFYSVGDFSFKDRLMFRRIDKQICFFMEKADFVVCRLPSLLGMRAALIAQSKGKKIAIEVGGCTRDAWFQHGDYRGYILGLIYERMMKKVVAKSEYTLYVTKSFLQERYPSKKSALTEVASNVELPDDFLRSLNYFPRKSCVKVAFIGSLSAKYKGLEDLVRALSLVADKRICLFVLGEGDRDTYKRVAEALGLSNRVFFSSPLAGGRQVVEWLSGMDLYVQPSHTEGLPRALIEAMSVGLPCIGSDAGGIPELLQDEAIFPKKNIGELARKIDSFSADYALRKRHSYLNKVEAGNYSSSVLRERINRFYEAFYYKDCKSRE